MQTTDSDLQACVTAIRKAERANTRKKGEMKKLPQTVRRMQQSGDLPENGSTNPSKRKKGYDNDTRSSKPTFKITKNGFLMLGNRNDFHGLTSTMKDYIREYNKKVENKQSVAGMQIPDGHVITNTARRMQHNEQSDDDSSEDKSPKKNPKKTILLDLGDTPDNRNQ